MADQVVLTASQNAFTKYMTIFVMVVLVASLATNALFFKTYYDLKNGESERQQMIKEQRESIDKQNGLIADLNIQIADLNKKLLDMDKKKQVIDKKKQDDTIHYGKLLPREEEDQFFTSNGFKGQRIDNGGRYFTNDDVVKVQLMVKENENLKAELTLAYDRIDTQKSIIKDYMEKCTRQENIIDSYKIVDEQQRKEIEKYKMEATTNKFYKWTAIIVGGILVGAVAAH